MKRVVSLLILGLVAASLGACSDDDSSGTDTNDTNGDQTDGDPADGDTGGAASSGVVCDPAGDGVCENEGDCEIILADEASAAARKCGLACFGGADDCAPKCMEEETDLTGDCAGCYLDFVTCSGVQCAAPCITDAAGDACIKCQEDKGCRSEFDECSGLSRE